MKKRKPSRLIVPAVEAAIGIPASKWAGYCYGIASAIEHAGLVQGATAVYGHWLGFVHPGSLFAERPIIHHGWLIKPNGEVVDPTRFAFECVPPYIYMGKNQGEYDEGGDVWRAANERPFPLRGPDDQLAGVKVDRRMRETLRQVAGIANAPVPLTMAQIFWYANLSVASLGPHAKAIYQFLTANKLRGFIPVDNYERVMRRHAPRRDRR